MEPRADRAGEGNDEVAGVRRRNVGIPAEPPAINPDTNTATAAVPPAPVDVPVLLFKSYSEVVLGVGKDTVPIPTPYDVHTIVDVKGFGIRTTVERPIVRDAVTMEGVMHGFDLHLG